MTAYVSVAVKLMLQRDGHYTLTKTMKACALVADELLGNDVLAPRTTVRQATGTS